MRLISLLLLMLISMGECYKMNIRSKSAARSILIDLKYEPILKTSVLNRSLNMVVIHSELLNDDRKREAFEYISLIYVFIVYYYNKNKN